MKKVGLPHPYAELIGMDLTQHGRGESLVTVDIEEKHINAQRVVHGAVMYAMADTGMGAAVYSTLAEAELCATGEIKIAYFKPARQGRLSCTSRMLNRGKRVASLEAEVFLEGERIAKAMGTFSIFTPRSKDNPVSDIP